MREREKQREKGGEGDTLNSIYKPFNYHDKVERQILLSFYNKEKEEIDIIQKEKALNRFLF